MTGPTTYPAVQVLVPGPLTTAHRTTQAVREAAQAAADYLRVEPETLMLDHVTTLAARGFPMPGRPVPDSVVYTFTTRPRDAG